MRTDKRIIAVFACAMWAMPPSAIVHAKVARPHGTVLTVMTSHGARVFQVEVARTEAQQARGLMFRTHIGPNAGMVFPFPTPRIASFWMKNCPIPEDMIFIRGDGTIARIAAMTTPYSLDPVSSGEPVRAVFEIAGGRAAQLGITPGNKVSW